MKNSVTFLLVTIIAIRLAAIDEVKLETAYESEIMPFIEANSASGQFRVADGAVLSYRAMPKPESHGILILLGGHTESYVKYAEFFYDLRDLNMSMYALDQRGQGFSVRMLPDPQKDHVADYNSFLSDLDSFITEVVKPRADDALLLLGHSFGAAVAAAYAERHPGAVAGLILSSPYLSLKAGPLAVGLIRIIDFFGGAEQYVPGGGPFVAVEFEENKETHSRARHERKMRDYVEYPEIRLGHPTNHWILELEKLGKEVRKNAGKITSPTLVLQAEYDEYANRAAQDALSADIAKCKKVMLKGAYHEVLIETDSIRDEALAEIRNFIASNFF